MFAPLPQLRPDTAGPAARQATYRYLIQLRGGGARMSCWRRHAGDIGWQRRCGPMALDGFRRHFAPGELPA